MSEFGETIVIEDEVITPIVSVRELSQFLRRDSGPKVAYLL